MLNPLDSIIKTAEKTSVQYPSLCLRLNKNSMTLHKENMYNSLTPNTGTSESNVLHYISVDYNHKTS